MRGVFVLQFALAAIATPAAAQVSLTALDVPYAQSFDGLPASGSATWTNNSTIPGWYHARTGAGTTVVANDGSSNAGNLYSYGTGTSTDRALGSLGSGNAAIGNLFWGVRLLNNTGATITSLDVAYTGEQWRNSAAAAQTIAFSYLVGSPGVTGSLAEFQSAGTAVTNLDFTSPITGGTAAALNGNVDPNRTIETFTIDGLDIPNGTEVMLRWSDPDHTGADHGLAIDDFSVTPHAGAGLPTLAIDDVSLSEGDGGTTTFMFTVTLSAPAGAGGVTFDIATAEDIADASDYVPKSLNAQTIPAGSTTYTFDVEVLGDLLPESDETFFVDVSNVTGASATDPRGVGRIVNDDAAPHLSIDTVSHAEGNAGTTTFTFTVSLDEPAPAGGVTFDIATEDNTATAPSDYTARSLTSQTIPAGATAYTFDVLVNGDVTSEPDENFFVNVTNVTNAIVNDGQGVGSIANDDMQKIHDLQGAGSATPIPPSQVVTVEGVVIGNYQGSGKLSGFFLQEEDTDVDADPNTSEGILVFCSSCPTAVAEGQRVRATGTVSEFFDMTELNATTAGSVVVTDAGNHLAEITPAPIALPIVGDVNAFYEAREGMLVSFTDTLKVSEYFELARYGQIELYPERPRQFTEDNAPSVAGNAAHLEALSRSRVILDDENNVQNWPLTLPDGSQFEYYPHANGGLGAGTQGVDFFRGGDEVHNLTGVLHWSFAGQTGTDAWRIRPTQATPAEFTVANPRPTARPDVGGAIKVVGMNLLNYFTTIDTTSSNNSGPCGPSGGQDCRGADSAAELNRQRERASIVICTLNPDVAGLMELENTTAHDTIVDLLTAVNARCGGAHPYTYVDTGGTLGGDAIRVELIYRTGVVAPFGSPVVDLDPVNNRPPTAQTFDVSDATNPAFGQRFTVVANHLKSKGCGGASGGDLDSNDGQSCFAATRTAQANRLLTWISGAVIPAAGGDTDVLLVGDFNSYAHETPVTTLTAGGYTDLETTLLGNEEYSYLFDGQLGHLDYAFASTSLASQVTGVAAWHINADEVPDFDYNDEVKDTGESDFEEKPDGSALTPPRVVFQPGTPYRASDHDPVIVGLFGTAADLSVGALADTPNPVVAGTNLTYEFTVSNAGPDAAAAATWTNDLPDGTTFVSLTSAAGWSCATPAIGDGGTVSCATPTFAPGAGASFTLVVAVDPSIADNAMLNDVVTVSTSSSDTNPANDTSTAVTTVTTSADLATTMTDTPDPVTAGADLTYTITLANAGPSDAASASLTDTLPAGTTFGSLTSPAGWSCTTPNVGEGGTVSCAQDSLASGNSVFTLVVAVDASVTAGTVITNTAVASSSTPDPNPGNESATATTTVDAALEGELTITPAEVDFGDQNVGTTSAPETVTLGNSGTASLDITALSSAKPPFSTLGGSCPPVPITLAPGASCTLVYTFAPTAPGPASQVLDVTANAAGSGTITLEGNGVATETEADIAVTITDGREFVEVGDTVDYVITVSNAGPLDALASVSDMLPPELDDGAWTCMPAGGAACANGSGNVLADTAALPAGTSVTYLYSATVIAGERIDNSVTAVPNDAVVDPNPGNNSASDATDTVVIFRDGFDTAGAEMSFDARAGVAGFAGATLRLDTSLLDRVGIMPVTIATGASDVAGNALAIDLARFGTRFAMRVVVRDASGAAERSAWRTVDLASSAVDFAWQPATPGERNGYVELGAGADSVQITGRDDTARLSRLRIGVADDRPWLSSLPNE
jgi:uncharacterized repeat protein (TIGR01451 family)